MVGTLFNTVTVAIGASAGLALGARWSEALKQKVFVVLGLFTLTIGGMMAFETESPIDLFLSLVLGTALGHWLKLQEKLSTLTVSSIRMSMVAADRRVARLEYACIEHAAPERSKVR